MSVAAQSPLPAVVAPSLRLAEAPGPAPGGDRAGSAAQLLLGGRGFSILGFLVDLGALWLAVLAALASAHAGVPDAPAILALPPVALALLWSRGLYARRLRAVVLEALVPAAGAITVAALAVVALDVYGFGRADDGGLVLRAWPVAVAVVLAGRSALGLIQRAARANGRGGRPTLIVGAGAVGALLQSRLREHPECGLEVVGFLDDDPVAALRPRVLGGCADLRRVARQRGIEHVVFAFSSTSDTTLLGLVRESEALGLDVSLVPRMYEEVNDRCVYDTLGGLPLLGLRATDPRSRSFAIKHVADRALALGALFALAPALALLALAVRVESSGPALYRQRRVGRDGQVFDLLKFRSMAPSTETGDRFTPAGGSAPGGVEGPDRRTRVGRFLRRSSLDELPQLLNVARGEMSLVGPRPEREEFVELFGRDIHRYGDRHRVKSGMTGWAQVHGLRGQTSLRDRVEFDNAYIRHWSLGMDARILLMTARAVLRPAE